MYVMTELLNRQSSYCETAFLTDSVMLSSPVGIQRPELPDLGLGGGFNRWNTEPKSRPLPRTRNFNTKKKGLQE